MNESFLYYIWQHQYFDKRNLMTQTGEPVEIFHQGTLNTHAGPDFLQAKIRIGEMLWAGSVEIHTLSSDWISHRHHYDGAYQNVILHVVWKFDKEALRADQSAIPVLVLESRIYEHLIADYKKLIHNPFVIPCARSFPDVSKLLKISMLDRTLARRLQTKSDEVLAWWKENNHDWEETGYQLLASSFGFKVNQEPFRQLAGALPYRIILKHLDHPVQTEALLFGQAGFLETEAGDTYYRLLQREYNLLAAKFTLHPRRLLQAQWKFLRLRPANFPTVRLAQFASLLHQRKNIFSRMIEAESPETMFSLFQTQPTEYWRDHYRFNKTTSSPVSPMGVSGLRHLMINAVVPLLVAYGRSSDDQSLTDRAIQLLESLPAEDNKIIDTYRELDYQADTAFDSQALIELYNRFCQRRNCLTCVIGASLLKPNTDADWKLNENCPGC